MGDVNDILPRRLMNKHRPKISSVRFGKGTVKKWTQKEAEGKKKKKNSEAIFGRRVYVLITSSVLFIVVPPMPSVLRGTQLAQGFRSGDGTMRPGSRSGSCLVCPGFA